MIRHSSVLPPELHRGKKCACWLLVSLTKCGCCSSLKEEINAFSKTKKQFPSRPIKRLAREEVQTPCFMLTWYVPRPRAHRHPKIPIKWYGSIYFVSLVEKKCSSICPEKNTENSIQMVSALWLPANSPPTGEPTWSVSEVKAPQTPAKARMGGGAGVSSDWCIKLTVWIGVRISLGVQQFKLMLKP